MHQYPGDRQLVSFSKHTLTCRAQAYLCTCSVNLKVPAGPSVCACMALKKPQIDKKLSRTLAARSTAGTLWLVCKDGNVQKDFSSMWRRRFLSSDVTALDARPPHSWIVGHKAEAIPLLGCSFTVCQWERCARVMNRTLNVMASAAPHLICLSSKEMF